VNLDEFAEGALSRGLSVKTVVVYTNALRPVMEHFAKQRKTLDELTAFEVADYADVQVRASTSSRALLRSSLRMYFEVARRWDSPHRAVTVPRRARMRCRALDECEASKLAGIARRRRDRAGLAVLLGLYCGLRRGEIASLRWGDLDGRWLTVVGKGAVRTIPVGDVVFEAWNILRAELPSRTHVFEGRWGEPCNPTTVWTWVDELSTESLGRHVTTHVLRHTALATALDSTGDLRAVQHFAGHAKPETTAGYTRTTERRLLAVANSIDYGDA
jgi:integrase